MGSGGAPRRSPGFGLALVAESTTGVLIHSELYAKPGDTPEDLGTQAAKQLCVEISLVRTMYPSAGHAVGPRRARSHHPPVWRPRSRPARDLSAAAPTPSTNA